MKQYSGNLYINGLWVEGEGEDHCSIDPATGEPVLRIKYATKAQVNDAVNAAKSAFNSWKKASFTERVAICTRFQDLVDTRKDELATTISSETGKVLWDSHLEVHALKNKVPITIQSFTDRCPEKMISLPNGSLSIAHKPYGPVAILGPYNFPCHLPHGQLIPALLAGNCVVLKPSELTPASAEACCKLWHEAGLPPGVLNMIHGARDVGSSLIDNTHIKGVYFTGSASTGKAIEAHSLQFPHRICALEMGGNNPLIIGTISNPDTAAFLTIQSSFITTGQRCSSARRLVVIKSRASDAFIDSLLSMTSNLKIGSYKNSPEAYMGPVVSKEAANHIFTKYQQIKETHSAKPLLEMTRLAPNTGFLTPGIIDVTNVSVPDEEIFGPLLQVLFVSDLREAVEIANQTNYGLTAGIISDVETEFQFAQDELEAGIVNWNLPLTGISSLAPFGGIKDSGNCRPAGYTAVDFCSYPQAQTTSPKPWRPSNLPPGFPSWRQNET